MNERYQLIWGSHERLHEHSYPNLLFVVSVKEFLIVEVESEKCVRIEHVHPNHRNPVWLQGRTHVDTTEKSSQNSRLGQSYEGLW